MTDLSREYYSKAMVTKLRPRSFTAGLLDRIERWGNKLPHPFNLFILFSLIVLIISYLAHALGLAVVHPLTGKQIAAINLLDRQGIQNIITKAVGNFTGFAPLGTVRSGAVFFPPLSKDLYGVCRHG